MSKTTDFHAKQAERRRIEAEDAYTRVKESPHAESDPFAANRAHSMVSNGVLTIDDFKKALGGVPADVL